MTSTRHGTVLRELQTLFTSGTTSGLTDSQLLQRFVSGQDDEAFAALVVRHGPTVFAVCRGVLRDPHDAEDAFQATFLILARKARTIRGGDSAGAWLHRVALRVAAQANIDAGRRVLHEQQASIPEARELGREGPWDDLLPSLHEEIGRLPEKYRAPIVLCDLGSLTRDQAAGQLGWPPGTVAGRLARGRDLLRTRLIRRGVAPACMAIGMTYAAKAARASIPPTWESKAIEVASRIGASPTTSGGTVSALAWTLAEVAWKASVRSRFVRVVSVGLACGVVALAGLMAALALSGPDSKPALTLVGTVVDPDGRPAPDVELVLAEGAFPAVTAPNVRRSFESEVIAPPAVLQQGRSDAKGSFDLAMLANGTEESFHWKPLSLWAYRPGSGLALRMIPEGWPPAGVPISLKLGRSASVAYRVIDPGGRPVAGASLTPAVFRGKPVPRALAEKFGVNTDGEGRARLIADAPGDLEILRVATESFGTQLVKAQVTDDGGLRTLTLESVGSVQGQIDAEDPAAVKGVPVRLRTVLDLGVEGNGVGGVAEVLTDDHGRFAVPAIAKGTLSVAFKPHPELPYRGRFTNHPQIEAGRATRIAISLKQAAHVRGVAREKETGVPIAGARVFVERNYDIPFALTDAQGRYSAYALPGSITPRIIAFGPYQYRYPASGNSQLIPEGILEYTLKPVEMPRGVTIEGVVVDSAGQPVPGAVVDASLYQDQLKRSVLADRDGAFQIQGVEPETEVILSAEHDELRTAVPVATKVGKGPITLKVGPGHTIAVAGRVLDNEGRPVSAATVRIDSRRRKGRLGGAALDYERLAFDEEGHENLYTAADGRFHSPRRFSPDLQYRAVVEAEGYSPEQSQWVDPIKETTFPDVIIRRIPTTRTVRGQAVDGAGTPVVGAVVSQSGDGPARTSTVTDAQGRFQLSGVFPEPAVLFVEGADLRFSGYPIDGSSQPVVLTVRRNEDPADPPLRPLPSPLPQAEADALALRLIEPELEGFLKPSKYEVGKSLPINIAPALLSITARIDPARTEDLVGRISLSTPEYNDLFRCYAALSLFPVNPQRAVSVAETIVNPLARSRFYCEASDTVPEEDRARKLELLEKALQLVRASSDPAPKMSGFGAVGFRLLDLGDASGTALLREGQGLAEALPKGPDRTIGNHLRSFAPKLARIDALAAFAMIDALKISDATRYYGGIVLGMADRDPEKVERFLARIELGDYRNLVTPRIVGRMVAKDPTRARRIIDAMTDPVWRATGLGLMARKLAPTDPKAAIALVDETLDLLIRVSKEGSLPEQPYVIQLVSVAAGLMPVAESLDAALLRRSFWKVAALRPPRSTTVEPGGRWTSLPAEVSARIALILARYDRTLARQILEPVAKRVKALDVERFPFGVALFAAAARIDPTWALELIETMPVGVANLEGFPRDQARRAVADILAGENTDPKNRLEMKYLRANGDSKDREP